MRSSRLVILAALAGLVLAGCGGHSSAPFPAHPSRLVTDDEFSTDAALALGLRPVGAVGLTGSSWAPALAPFLKGTENLGPKTGGSANLDAVQGANPSAILGPAALRAEGWSAQLSSIAPTRYYDPAGSWRAGLRSVAASLGIEQRANAVIRGLTLRAVAIRAQVAGRTVAVVDIIDSRTFDSPNDDESATKVYETDLGLRNAHLRQQQYPYGCAPAPSPSKPCTTNPMYAGAVSFLSEASALLVETLPAGSLATTAFERSSYFNALPAVRAGRVVSSPSYAELGPLGVGYLYSAVARAFGLEELHAGRSMALTVSTGRRLCWASRRASPLALVLPGLSRVTLHALSGCAMLTPAESRSLGSLRARVEMGGTPLPVSRGALPVAV